MVGLVVREMLLEDVQSLVDGLNKSELACERVDGANTTVNNSTGACGDLIVDVAGGEHGLGTATEVCLVEAALDAALAVVKPPS